MTSKEIRESLKITVQELADVALMEDKHGVLAHASYAYDGPLGDWIMDVLKTKDRCVGFEIGVKTGLIISALRHGDISK